MKRGKILVTGSAGFLGKNVSRYFSKKGWIVCGVDHGKLDEEDFRSLEIDQWIESEISEDSLNRINKSPDLIVHCAGSGSVGFSVTNPREDFEANVSSLLPVLEFMRLKCPNAKLIYPSSSAVYGEKEGVPIKESDSLSPISPYGYHKKIAEELLESYNKNFGLNISIIRFFSLYGQGLKKQLFWDACEKFKSSKGKAVEFFGTGEETRDWLNIHDAVRLIEKLSQYNNNFEIVNGANGDRITVKETISILKNIYNENIEITFNGKIKKGDPKYYLADISRIKEIGWKPEVGLDEGLAKYVDWYKSQI